MYRGRYTGDTREAPSSLMSCVSEMVTMVCAREEVAFISVAPTW